MLIWVLGTPRSEISQVCKVMVTVGLFIERFKESSNRRTLLRQSMNTVVALNVYLWSSVSKNNLKFLVPFICCSDRTPFPVVPLARIGETRHFGGALQVDRDLPQNYAAGESCTGASVN